MNCTIVKNKNNQIIDLQTPGGDSMQLFTDLKKSELSDDAIEEIAEFTNSDLFKDFFIGDDSELAELNLYDLLQTVNLIKDQIEGNKEYKDVSGDFLNFMDNFYKFLNSKKLSYYKNLYNTVLRHIDHTLDELRIILEEVEDEDELVSVFDEISDVTTSRNKIIKEKKMLDEHFQDETTIPYGYIAANMFEHKDYIEHLLRRVKGGFSNRKNVANDLKIAKHIVEYYIEASDFSNPTHSYFTRYELESEEHKDIIAQAKESFKDFATETEVLLNDIAIAYNDILKQTGEETFEDSLNLDLLEPLKDINILQREYTDISDVPVDALQLVSAVVKDAVQIAQDNNDAIVEKYDKLRERISGRENEIYEMLHQTFSNTDNRTTGDMVYIFTREWTDQYDKAIKKRSTGALFSFEKSNVLIIDPLKLDNKRYQSKLKNLLGIDYLYFITEARKKKEQFDAHLNALIEAKVRAGNGSITKEDQKEIDNFIHTSSPYLRSDLYSLNKRQFKSKHKTDIFEKNIIFDNTYVVAIPSKEDHYDQKYQKAMKDKDARDLYNTVVEDMRKIRMYFPVETRQGINAFTLPLIYKTLKQELAESGVRNTLTNAVDKMYTSLSENIQYDIDYSLRDAKGNPIKKIRPSQINTYSGINDYISLRIQEEKQAQRKAGIPENEIKITDEDKENFRREFISKQSKERSMDIITLMKSFSLNAEIYKEKQKIESVVEAAFVHLGTRLEVEGLNNNRSTEFGNLLFKKDGTLPNLMKQYDYYRKVFYGETKHKKEGIVKNSKILSKEEKELSKRMDELINDPETPETDRKKLQKLKGQLGGNLAGHKVGNSVIKFGQILGLGWNIPSALSNIGSGIMSSLIQAADGRVYNEDNYFGALGVMLNSVLKNYTFNAVANQTSNKIRAGMDRMNILKESKHEVFTRKKSTTSLGKVARKLKFLNPFNPQTRSEYFIQGADMIATMKAIKVKKNGEEMSVWDAMDEKGRFENVELTTKNGRIITDEQKIMLYVKRKVDDVVADNQGNYDPQNVLKIKETTLGRAHSLFRTWMFKGVFMRVSGEIDNRNQGNLKRKGRYRTALPLAYPLLALGIPPIPGATISFVKVDGMSYLQQLGYANLYTFQRLQRALTYIATFGKYKGNFGKTIDLEELGFSKADIANLRTGVAEQILITSLYGISMMLKAALAGDDDDDTMALIFSINYLSRMLNDLELYTSPKEWYKMTTNTGLLPPINVFIKLGKFYGATRDTILGELTIEHGTYADRLKMVHYGVGLVPLGNNLYRTVDQFNTVLDPEDKANISYLKGLGQ